MKQVHIQAANSQYEIQRCPACGRMSRHRATRDRVLAPVLWCLSCFHVHIEGSAWAPDPRSQGDTGRTPARGP